TRHRLGAVSDDACEEARAVDGHREVGDPSDGDIEDRRLVTGRVERPDHRKGGEVDPMRAQPRLLYGGELALDHVATRGDDDDASPLAFGRVDLSQRLVLEHRL